MRTPDFWRERGLAARLLIPASWAWRAGRAIDTARAMPRRGAVPTIVVGNAVVGGAGKTPTTLAITDMARRLGHEAHIVSRGHGGRLAGAGAAPHRVDPVTDTAAEVGDEPLMAARYAPVWVARDRLAGIAAAAAAGADLAILDDGLQHTRLAADLACLVLDGAYGLGNGLCLPAGPLREPAERAAERADAMVLIGDDAHGLGRDWAAGGKPLLRARVAPRPEESARLRGARLLAFAGIAHPAKFFDTLAETGATLVETVPFGDHHVWSPDAIMQLVDRAAALGARPITTEKDAARLPQTARDLVDVLHVQLVFDDPPAMARAIERVLTTGERPA